MGVVRCSRAKGVLSWNVGTTAIEGRKVNMYVRANNIHMDWIAGVDQDLVVLMHSILTSQQQQLTEPGQSLP